MSVTAAIRKMLDEGLTLDQALTAAEAFEASMQPKLTARQERNRRYYEARKEQADRLKASEKRLNKTEPDASEKRLKASESVLNSDALARVVVSSLPSLHSEEVSTSEPNGSSVGDVSREGEIVAPEKPPPKSKRGTRLPDDWEPSDADVAVARAEGLTDEEIFRAAREFRNFWTSRAGSAATKLSWSRTWENRVSEVADRLRRNGPRLVASTGQPGGNRRGAVSFADIFVERHGPAANREPVSAGGQAVSDLRRV